MQQQRRRGRQLYKLSQDVYDGEFALFDLPFYDAGFVAGGEDNSDGKRAIEAGEFGARNVEAFASGGGGRGDEVGSLDELVATARNSEGASARRKILVDINTNYEFVARKASGSERASERSAGVGIFPVVLGRGFVARVRGSGVRLSGRLFCGLSVFG